ncbi:hypothetical protein J7T55_015456 [Diaporthe amygdali]|uniref:uncharacterized protein n=1 Tax=Phomopsis amygdali TaxID=1214568 RepID=UPI0022FEB410|nr:uncharacterized protein J7T55_015456 [Diaporthe amygdali]KAJ0120724.1 hypothetical protein J7T55_015456 [Diaporthe amygdali]
MDHLSEDYGVDVIQVEYIAKDLSGARLPRTKEEFHKFPKQLGWELQLGYKLETHGDENTPHQSLDTLLTAWLFFGLIFVVVQEDGNPILTIDELHSGPWLSTKSLNAALKRWVDWEKNNPQDLWARMIQVEYVLEKARQVVRRNCGYNIEKDHVEYRIERNEVANHLSDEKAMALMTLGECLWQVKSRIMEGSGDDGESTFLQGWHGDDDDGWGPPRWVFMRMLEDRWCPRAVLLLKGQLRSNATLLLQAYYAYKHSKRMIDRHEHCTQDECHAKTLNSSSAYSPLCVPGCKYQDQDGGCEMVGPNMDEVTLVLQGRGSTQASDIPVLRFSNDDSEEPVELRVEALPKKGDRTFATISHVWSDGWGNEKENKLHTCQLKFIRRQLKRVNNGKDIGFWMDTLVVPVKENMTRDEKKTKKKAIGQIFQVFDQSTYTVVLDNGLCSTDGAKDKPTQTAMKILASFWMRRLWTLQESFLSEQLHFAFLERTESLDWKNLISYDELKEDLGYLIDNELKSPLTGTVKDMLAQNIMGKGDREDQRTHMSPEKAAFWIASAWSAARWRTTSNTAHETLALATLLGLKYQGTQIEEAGLTKLEDVDDKLREQLVTEFWKTFHGSYRGAIPPGIIFLPGDKVKDHKGFGWAPKTWLSAHEIDYPNPLSRWTGKTDLLDNGLEVKYPGFLLHTIGDRARREILGMDRMDQGTVAPAFKFPANRDLVEWYSAKPADPRAPPFLTGIASRNPKTPLAIILSRPRPVESPPEIGLLVEIYRDEPDKEQPPRRMYSCQIIRRMHVWREMNPFYLAGADRNGPTASASAGSGDNLISPHWKIIGGPLVDSNFFCLGEAVAPEQRWVVDGYNSKRLRSPAISTMKDSLATKEGGKQRVQTEKSPDLHLTSIVVGGAGPSRTSQTETTRGGFMGWSGGWPWFGQKRSTPEGPGVNQNQAQIEPPTSLKQRVTFPTRPSGVTEPTPAWPSPGGVHRSNTNTLW